MHILSKLAEWLLQPANLGFLILLAATPLLWSPYRRAGRWLLTALATAAVLIAVLPVSAWLVRPLEDRFPAPDQPPTRIDGIVVLGGTIDQFLTRHRGQVALNRTAERLTETVVLARRYPSARIVFSGGSAAIFDQSVREAQAARRFLAAMGVDASRIELESRSRNTHENAVYALRAAAPKPGERWLLVTSAAHMPRAIGAFRAVGWDVIPYPVDYLTGVAPKFPAGWGLQAGLSALATAAREWTALAVYRLLGRTTTFFPRP